VACFFPPSWDNNPDIYAECWDDTIVIDRATPIVLAEGQKVTGIDAQLAWAGEVSGKITDAVTGQPITGEYAKIKNVATGITSWGYTEEDGSYSERVPAGDYTVKFETDEGFYETQWWNGVVTEEEARVITVPPKKAVTEINAALQKLGRLAGTVLGGAAGQPLEGVQVDARKPGDYRSTVTDANGKYSLDYLPPGTWSVRFYQNRDNMWLPQAWKGKPWGTIGDPVIVKRDTTTDIGPVTLQPGGVLTGFLRASDGGDPQNLTVNVYQRQGTKYVKVDSQEESFYGDPYYFRLPPGEYKTEYTDPDGRYETGYWKDAKDLVSATSFTIVQGQTVSIDFQMKPMVKAFTTAPVPTISGLPQVGSQLTTEAGTWQPAPDTLAYQWNRKGTPIAGATAASYTLKPADLGATITVSVTATKAGYTPVTKKSAASTAVTAGSIGNASVTIAGTANVGAKLTAKTGAWTPAPVALSYQWKRSGALIAGATSSTYQLTAADFGKTVKVTVTGTKQGYTTKSLTSATVSVRAGTLVAPTPTISGTPAVGGTLAATVGTWSPSPATFTYQWKRNGSNITGATASTYKLTAADAGATIKVTVTGKRSGYTTLAKTSVSTAQVKRQLTASPVPTITGTPKVGQTLTAKTGTWSPNPVKLTLQWKRNGVAISGATATTYKMTTADKGKQITLSVTGSKSGFVTVVRTSSPTKLVQ
jgi:hypothetical protein